ncbi:MAG: translation elongation factor Ts [Phycisphaerae bacterium]|nr:translation elongation factor Ts [Phycisphaerae bacterium]
MAEISAAQVQALRARTDLPLMDCKKALIEAKGDESAAMEILRKRYADKMSSRADKEAANGRIGAYCDAKGGALVELRCETDFVATNSVFTELSNQIARQVAATHVKDVAQLAESKCEFAGGRSVRELISDAYGKLNEKMEIRAARCIHGACATYVHHNGKVGAIVAFDKPNDAVGRQVCMHIASRTLLLGLNREAVDAKLVQEAREHAASEVTGKPPNIIEKIVAGKLDKWFAERVLLEQPFALDDKITVGEAVRQAGVTITGYLRFEVGGRN